jgi:hypothetical protein
MAGNYKAVVRNIDSTMQKLWHVYNITLDAVYGWADILDMAQKLIDGDVNGLGSVTISEKATTPEIECIQNLDTDNVILREVPLFQRPYGLFSVAGFSADYETPVKITWYESTPLLRIYSLKKLSEDDIKDYLSTF